MMVTEWVLNMPRMFVSVIVGWVLDLPTLATFAARVKSTAPPARSQQDSGRKEAKLENGVKIQVPLFVAPGEWVSVDVKTGRYVERVRVQHKKGA
jgi:hypothetical protein